MRKLLFLILLHQIRSNCDSGCLRCVENSICQICDTLELYKLETQTQTCQKRYYSECLQLDLFGKCTKCPKDFFLSPQTLSCVQVSQTSLNSNKYCQTWKSDVKCQKCEPTFYLNSGICQKVNTLTENCLDYSASQKCLICETGFFYDSKELICQKLPSAQNCISFVDSKCKNCKNDFYYNENNFLFKHQDLETEAEKLEFLKYLEQSEHKRVNYKYKVSFCQPVQIQNCLVYQSKKKCSQCKEGYFVNTMFQCQHIVDSAIHYCAEYSNAKKCLSCKQGFYLQNPSFCMEVSLIQNCLEYSTTDSQTICLQCYRSFYLDSGACKMRENIAILFCLKFNPLQDGCEKCKDGYFGNGFNQNFSKCEQEIYNCAKHDFTQQPIECEECVDRYFLENPLTCTYGLIKGCQRYLQDHSVSICLICLNGFYLEKGQCIKIPQVDKCDVYGNVIDNFCQNCGLNSISTIIKSDCLQNSSLIENCKIYEATYANTSKCQTCQDKYYLFENECKSIQLEGCLSSINGNPTICEKCADYMGKIAHNFKNTIECKPIFESFDKFCKINNKNVDNSVISNRLNCLGCEVGAYMYSVEDEKICVHENRLNFIPGFNRSLESLCVMFDKNQNCIKCKHGRYLTNDENSCDLECDNVITLLSLDTNNEFLRDQCLNEDDPTGNENFYKGISVVDKSTTVLIKCSNRAQMPRQFFYLEIVTLDITTSEDGSYIDPYYDSVLRDYTPNQKFRYPMVNSCEEYRVDNMVINNKETLEKPNWCEFYQKETINTSVANYNCIKCLKHGYSSRPDSRGAITCDTYITNCSPKKIYNIPLYWKKLTPCVQCEPSATQRRVPIMFYHSANANFEIFRRFDLSRTDYAISHILPITEISDFSHQCWEDTQADFATRLGQLPAAIRLITDCGMYVHNLSFTKSAYDSTNINNANVTYTVLQCAFCRPGYKPTFKNGCNNNFVTDCTVIPNCETDSIWVNSCSKCQQNYSWKFDTSKPTGQKLQYHFCVQNPVLKCLAYDQTASECVFCEKGWTFNLNKKCVKLTAPYCKEGQYFKAYNKSLMFEHFEIYVYLMGQRDGCAACSTDTHVVITNNRTDLPDFQCIKDSFLKKAIDNVVSFASVSQYIQNCSNYQRNSNPSVKQNICNTCQNNYIVTQNGSKCISQSVIPNCEIADNTSGCFLCRKTFGIMNQVGNHFCIPMNIQFCESVELEQANAVAEVKCLKCVDPYYLTSNKCEHGYVPNCKEHSQIYQCTVCEDNFALVKASEISNKYSPTIIKSRDYCMPIPKALECSQGNIRSLKNASPFGYAQFECTKCVRKQIFPQEQLPHNSNQCFVPEKIDNCKTYFIKHNNQLPDSNFSCLECEPGFYRDLTGFECLKRNMEIKNCLKYDFFADCCEKCENLHFLSTDKKYCNKNPEQFHGCLKYDFNEGTPVCTKCSGLKHKFQNGVCIRLANLVDNCSVMKNEYECEICTANYLLQPVQSSTKYVNRCELTDLTNCEAVNTLTECAICQPGYFLEANQTCNQIADENCLEFSDSNLCTRCSSGYFKDTSDEYHKCTLPQTQISNCDIYENEEVCLRCAQGYQLALDGKCLKFSNFDQNCSFVLESKEKQCFQCSIGYMLVEGVCQLLVGIQSFKEGCSVPDIFDDQKCAVCQSGFYMQIPGICFSNIKTVEGGPVGENQPLSNLTGLQGVGYAAMMVLLMMSI